MIVFFNSIFKEKKFYGVAKMTSDIQADKSFKYWAEGARFFGLCNIEWIFVKTIDDINLCQIKEFLIN